MNLLCFGWGPNWFNTAAIKSGVKPKVFSGTTPFLFTFSKGNFNSGNTNKGVPGGGVGGGVIGGAIGGIEGGKDGGKDGKEKNFRIITSNSKER